MSRSIYTSVRRSDVIIRNSRLHADLISAVTCYFETMLDARSRQAMHLAIVALNAGHTVSLAQCLDAMPARRQRRRRSKLHLVASNPEPAEISAPSEQPALRIVARGQRQPVTIEQPSGSSEVA